MKMPSRGYFKYLLLVAVVAVAGCAVSGTPTPGVPPTEPSAAEPTATAIAEITTLERTVMRLRGESITEVPQAERIDIVEDDKVELAERARAELKFIDGLVVELLRGSEIEFVETRLEPEGSLFFKLRQIAGTTRAELGARRDARLQIDTELMTATVTSATEDAEFVICHKPQTATCVVTVKGAVEVATPEKSVIVEEGEGTYVFTDVPLSDPICVVQEEFQAWLSRERNAEENKGLAAVVRDWPQEPCATGADTESPPTSIPLPSSQQMVRVEGGLYEIGHREPDEYHIAAREIEIAPFWIDAYEVTIESYAEFLRATGHAEPSEWVYGADRASHPVTGVTWSDAEAYCANSAKRLPTEVEWEIAGRGPGAPPPLYPWGDDPFADGQVDQVSAVDTHPVGTAHFDSSPFGVYDMSGNVREWVSEPYAPIPEGTRILRGGRHGFLRDLAYREVVEQSTTVFLPFAGFRCAADQVQGD